MEKILSNKKGAEHIEIILSFIIFIGMLAFLLYMFPIYKSEKSKTGLVVAERAILDYSDANVTYFTIITESSPKKCFYIANQDIANVVIVNDNNEIVKGSIDHDYKILYLDEGNRVNQIYSSPYFIENPLDPKDIKDCKLLEEQKITYQKGVERKIDAISYDRTLDLNKSYYEDYNSLRTELGLQKKDNFGFIVYDLKGNNMITAMRKKPGRAEVLAGQVPVQIFYNDGTFTFGLLNVQIW